MTPRRWFLAGLVVLAVAVRLPFFLADPHPYALSGLSGTHGEIARNIASHGKWFVENKKAGPVVALKQRQLHELVDPSDVNYTRADSHPDYKPVVVEPVGEGALLGGIWAVTGDQRYAYLQVLQIVVDALMVLLVYWIGLRLFDRPRAALLAAAFYAVFIPIAALTKVPHLDIWGIDWTIVIAATLIKAGVRPPSYGWLAAAGVATGLGVYFRPGLLLIAPLMALAALPWSGWRRALAVGGIPLVVAALLLVPWVVRNYNDYHRFIPTRIGIGQNLWEGLGERSNDFGAKLNDIETANQVRRERPKLEYGTPAYDDYLRQKAIDAIENDPVFYGRLVAERAVRSTVLLNNSEFWVGNTAPVEKNVQRAGGGAVGFVVGRITYAFEHPFDTVKTVLARFWEPLLFLLALVTVVVTRRRYPRQHLLLLAVVVATILPYLFLHFEPRYVLPAAFAYMIWAAVGIELFLPWLADRWRARSARKTAVEPAT